MARSLSARALGERFVSIVMKLLRGPASRVGEAPLLVGSTLRPWMAAAPGAAEATEGWLASERFPSFESVFAGGAGGEGDVEGEGAGKGARYATAPKVRGGRGGRGVGRGVPPPPPPGMFTALTIGCTQQSHRI